MAAAIRSRSRWLEVDDDGDSGRRGGSGHGSFSVMARTSPASTPDTVAWDTVVSGHSGSPGWPWRLGLELSRAMEEGDEGKKGRARSTICGRSCFISPRRRRGCGAGEKGGTRVAASMAATAWRQCHQGRSEKGGGLCLGRRIGLFHFFYFFSVFSFLLVIVLAILHFCKMCNLSHN